jgi:hypothetical protein
VRANDLEPREPGQQPDKRSEAAKHLHSLVLRTDLAKVSRAHSLRMRPDSGSAARGIAAIGVVSSLERSSGNARPSMM